MKFLAVCAALLALASHASASSSDCNIIDTGRHFWISLQKGDAEEVASMYHRAAVSYRNGELNALTAGKPMSEDQLKCLKTRVDERRVLESIGRDSNEGRHLTLQYAYYVDDAEPIHVVHALEFDRATCSISVERVFHATDGAGFKRFVKRTADDCFSEAALDGGFTDNMARTEECWGYFVNEDVNDFVDCFADGAVWYRNGEILSEEIFTKGFWNNYFDAVEVNSAQVLSSARKSGEHRLSVYATMEYTVRDDDDSNDAMNTFSVYLGQNIEFNDDGDVIAFSEVTSDTQAADAATGAYEVMVPDMLSSFENAAAALAYADMNRQFGRASYVIPGDSAFYARPDPVFGLHSAVLRDEMVDTAPDFDSAAHPTYITVTARVQLSSRRQDLAKSIHYGVNYNRVLEELTARGDTVGEAISIMYHALRAADGGDVSALRSTLQDTIDANYQFMSNGDIERAEDGSVEYRDAFNTLQNKLREIIQKF